MSQNVVSMIGSYNVGLFLKGQVIPSIGQTVIGDQFYEGGGGKGSNQAVAASFMGARTRFIGRIGKDKYGSDAIAMYRKYGISTDMIKVDEGTHTGISVILIDKDGQNSICVVPGANYHLSKEDIDDAVKVIGDSCIVGFQLENNLEVVDYAIRKVHAMDIRTLLDPAPAAKLPEDLYPCIDYIKPNEHEATILTNIKVTDAESAKAAGEWFLNRGVKTAIITLGEQGAVLVQKDQYQFFKAPKVTAKDTTGAGDCFSGALMAALSQGKTIEEAIVFANYAAALSVTRLGVIEAIPKLSEVLAFMDQEK
ncbi:MAG: ribokinase [Clostridia bacterium]